MKRMKKVLAGLLAATMVMSMSVTAFAAETEDVEIVTITKKYVLTNPDTINPEETFSFTHDLIKVTDVAEGITKDNGPALVSVSPVTFNTETATIDGAEATINVKLPEYTSVGVYTYEITETPNNIAGVTYFGETAGEKIYLVVTVQQGENDTYRVAAVHTEIEYDPETADPDEYKGKKTDEFENKYSAGSLVIKKVVTGNMGDQSKVFDAKVTFSSTEEVKSTIGYYNGTEMDTIEPNDWQNGVASATIKVKHGETNNITFTNIPYNVTYIVEENDYASEGYETSIAYDDNNKKINSASENVVITNTKNEGVDTGISLDSAPYLLLLAFAAVGVFAVVNKKREEEF